MLDHWELNMQEWRQKLWASFKSVLVLYGSTKDWYNFRCFYFFIPNFLRKTWTLSVRCWKWLLLGLIDDFLTCKQSLFHDLKAIHTPWSKAENSNWKYVQAIAKIRSVKNARAWVSMVSYFKKNKWKFKKKKKDPVGGFGGLH